MIWGAEESRQVSWQVSMGAIYRIDHGLEPRRAGLPHKFPVSYRDGRVENER